jgi:hypothetical protein
MIGMKKLLCKHAKIEIYNIKNVTFIINVVRFEGSIETTPVDSVSASSVSMHGEVKRSPPLILSFSQLRSDKRLVNFLFSGVINLPGDLQSVTSIY